MKIKVLILLIVYMWLCESQKGAPPSRSLFGAAGVGSAGVVGGLGSGYYGPAASTVTIQPTGSGLLATSSGGAGIPINAFGTGGVAGNPIGGTGVGSFSGGSSSDGGIGYAGGAGAGIGAGFGYSGDAQPTQPTQPPQPDQPPSSQGVSIPDAGSGAGGNSTADEILYESVDIPDETPPPAPPGLNAKSSFWNNKCSAKCSYPKQASCYCNPAFPPPMIYNTLKGGIWPFRWTMCWEICKKWQKPVCKCCM